MKRNYENAKIFVQFIFAEESILVTSVHIEPETTIPEIDPFEPGGSPITGEGDI